MPLDLLEKTRKISRLFSSYKKDAVSYPQISAILGDITTSNVYIIDRNGKILGKYINPFVFNSCDVFADELVGEKFNRFFRSIIDTRNNIKLADVFKLIGVTLDGVDDSCLCMIIPMSKAGEKVGTLFLLKHNESFNDEDTLIAEYCATLLSSELMNIIYEEIESENKKLEIIESALATLSSTEIDALIFIFDELKSSEGQLVASRIADKVGITRSVIVNALRKIESAELIETRSLGMKGTYIKITNDRLIQELKKYRSKL
ncbi:GTP-sensing pleiotropic transcriptional regulator CodY [Caldicellulosiruptoraceae bacterium PP1]